MKKFILDIVFIVVAGIFAVTINEYQLLEEYSGFALIPIIIAYYIGQFIAKKYPSTDMK